MTSTTTAKSPIKSAAAPAKGKAPAPEAHLAIAEKHAKAQQHHVAAADALKAGRPAEAKKHTHAAAEQSDAASNLIDDIVAVYEVWEV
jgi:hypothetical protein